MEANQVKIHDMLNLITAAKLKIQLIKKGRLPKEEIFDVAQTILDKTVTGLVSLYSQDKYVDNYGTFYRHLETILKIKVEAPLQRAITSKQLMEQDKIALITENLIENAAKFGATLMTITDEIIGECIVESFADNGRGCDNCELIGTGYTTGGQGTGTVAIKEWMESIGGSALWMKNDKGGTTAVLKYPLNKREISVKI